MRVLYFDIDGTVLFSEREGVKPALADGQLQRAVSRAGIERLVCVGNFTKVVKILESAGIDYDGVGIVFSLCNGAFEDEKWFRDTTTLIDDPDKRVSQINQEEDWYYVDDLALHYCEVTGNEELYDANVGERLFVPEPMGDGRDILNWLACISQEI